MRSGFEVRTAEQQTQKATLMTEAARQLVEFWIANIGAVILTLNENVRAARLRGNHHHVEEAVARRIGEDDVDALAPLVDFALFYRPDEIWMQEERKEADGE